jgi:flagellar protein FlgJ
MIGQAALETGWGRSELRFSDGTPTYNLFGIKAGRNWQGAVAEATTTEYVAGRAVRARSRSILRRTATRSDARLLRGNGRYAGALPIPAMPRSMRRACSRQAATDPRYADKLTGSSGGEPARRPRPLVAAAAADKPSGSV